MIHLYMPEFQSNQPKKPHTSPDDALYVIWLKLVRCYTSAKRQRNDILMAFRCQADDGPLLVVFGSPHQLKKPWQIWTPTEKLSVTAPDSTIERECFLTRGPYRFCSTNIWTLGWLLTLQQLITTLSLCLLNVTPRRMNRIRLKLSGLLILLYIHVIASKRVRESKRYCFFANFFLLVY